MTAMRTYLRVAKSGNLVETTEGMFGKRWHRVVLDTSGLGDRRTRKVAARVELAKRTPAPRVYATFMFHTFAVGRINTFSGDIKVTTN